MQMNEHSLLECNNKRKMLRSRALQETSLFSVLVGQTTVLDFQFYEPAFICVTGRLDISLNRLPPPPQSLWSLKGDLRMVNW